MKLERVIQKLLPVLPILQCPKCGTAFTVHGSSLCCEKNHCFDLSSKGYVNVAPNHRQDTDKYDESLFLSRSEIMQGSYYDQLRHLLVDLIKAHGFVDHFTLVDVGCGEGTHTEFLAQNFPNANVIGTDISRAAIQKAAGGMTKANWMICDLKKMPLQTHSADVLLDILTPADYSEFARVLKPDGILIKVFPDDLYLQEIRNAVAPYLSSAEGYHSMRVGDHLTAHADVLNDCRVFEQFPLDEQASQAFLRMTPMTFSVPQEVLQDIRITEITIALHVCCCRLNK